MAWHSFARNATRATGPFVAVGLFIAAPVIFVLGMFDLSRRIHTNRQAQATLTPLGARYQDMLRMYGSPAFWAPNADGSTTARWTIYGQRWFTTFRDGVCVAAHTY